MAMSNSSQTLVISPLLLLLAACGGGDERVASAPAPVSAPGTPTTSAPAPASVPVTIFTSPTPQEYASIGVSTTSAGDGYKPVEMNARLADVSFEPDLQPKIRYDAAGYYELQLPGAEFDRLIHYKGLLNPTPSNNFFQTASAPQNYATFITRPASQLGFSYSELAGWTDATSGRVGYVAFGSPTSVAAMPVSGTATYNGPVSGMVDITDFDYLYGGYYFVGVGGDVTLIVDFSQSLLTGSLDLNLQGGTNQPSVGTFVTLPIPLTSGTNSFSGRFDTSHIGFNQFNGIFTGTSAQEAIGSWALPIMIDGQLHQAIGAWIARRGD